MENRKHTRLPIEIEVDVAVKLELPDGSLQCGKTKNISFGGVYVNLEKQLNIQPGNKCNITLVLKDKPRRIDIKFQCIVVHVNKDGIGLRFICIDGENYENFKYLMINHSPEPKLLLDELSKNPGLDIPNN